VYVCVCVCVETAVAFAFVWDVIMQVYIPVYAGKCECVHVRLKGRHGCFLLCLPFLFGSHSPVREKCVLYCVCLC